MMMENEYTRIPLTKREYYALREVFGIVNAFDRCAHDLKTRCQQIPNGWRDLRLICSKAEKLMGDLLKTVPVEKLRSMKAELGQITCEVKCVKDFTGRLKAEGFSYVPDDALSRVVARLIGDECLVCDKSAKQGKRCPISKDIEALYPWPMPPRGDRCPLAGLSAGVEEDL